VLHNIEVEYSEITRCDTLKVKAVNSWSVKSYKMKCLYLRRYQTKVWPIKGRYVLLRPYLYNKNLWYSAKKGTILNFSIIKSTPLTGYSADWGLIKKYPISICKWLL
jgi:hypothetical protein